jgi:hypothetical protein
MDDDEDEGVTGRSPRPRPRQSYAGSSDNGLVVHIERVVGEDKIPVPSNTAL